MYCLHSNLLFILYSQNQKNNYFHKFNSGLWRLLLPGIFKNYLGNGTLDPYSSFISYSSLFSISELNPEQEYLYHIMCLYVHKLSQAHLYALLYPLSYILKGMYAAI